MESVNTSLFLFLNAGPDTPEWAIYAGALIAKRVIYLIPLMLVSMWFWGNLPYRQTALKALLVTAAALALNQLIGWYIPSERPFVIGLGHSHLAHAPTASFPSNHLAIFVSVGLCAWRGAAPRLGAFVLLTGAVVAWARVFVGVHFPLDMLGSVVTAGIAYYAITPVWNRYGEKLTMQLERAYRRILAIPISIGLLRY